MFDNLLFQSASNLLEDDIRSGKLPGAVLFSGEEASGKLTAALETARVLSCTNSPRGKWSCTCPSCLKNKALVHPNVMLLGGRDSTLEIRASRRAFLNSVSSQDSHVGATRYLFLRAVRKLTNRFNPILWQDSKDLSKIAPLLGEIDEYMEELDVEHELPELKKIESLAEKIVALCQKLEGSFMYDSIPVLQIRNLSAWAHIGAAEGTKVMIIEKAERLLEGVRNALLKILEEPPENTVFILTTTRRSAVMPTILSRVRTYNFSARTDSQAEEIIERVFHSTPCASIENHGVIQSYLESFLPVSPSLVEQAGKAFFGEIVEGKIPNVSALLQKCGKFEPRILLKIFLTSIENLLRDSFKSAAGTSAASECTRALREAYLNISTYNQSIQSALETLVRDIALVNKKNSNILRSAAL